MATLAVVDRNLAPVLGIRCTGVHLICYVRDHDAVLGDQQVRVHNQYTLDSSLVHILDALRVPVNQQVRAAVEQVCVAGTPSARCSRWCDNRCCVTLSDR
jgi:hypothetical protein